MRRNLDLVHLFDVPQPRGENIVMNCQRKEIPENVEQRIGVMPNNERFPKPCESEVPNRQMQKEVNPRPEAFISALGLRQRDQCQQIIRTSVLRATDDVKGDMAP